MKEKFVKGSPIPESCGLTADLYHEVRELRLAMQKEVDLVKARETELKASLIDRLDVDDGDTGASGKRYRAQITTKTKPCVEDWELVHDFVLENGRFDILQKRLADKAIEEIWSAGEEVPGVSSIRVKDVSVTKI